MNFPFERDAITEVHLSPFFVLLICDIYIYIYIYIYIVFEYAIFIRIVLHCIATVTQIKAEYFNRRKKHQKKSH